MLNIIANIVFLIGLISMIIYGIGILYSGTKPLRQSRIKFAYLSKISFCFMLWGILIIVFTNAPHRYESKTINHVSSSKYFVGDKEYSLSNVRRTNKSKSYVLIYKIKKPFLGKNASLSNSKTVYLNGTDFEKTQKEN